MKEQIKSASFAEWACSEKAKSSRQCIIDCRETLYRDKDFLNGLLYAIQFDAWKSALEYFEKGK